ncbi:hypothetical protein OAW23_00500 [Flavobacteriales bacterium]|nr:hypothetical protein [Flavobacteriales bacterium]
MKEILLFVVIICIYFIPIVIYSLMAKWNKLEGSDHYFHSLLIQMIKTNKNRFITSYSNILGENRFAYPQLLHWVLAKFQNISFRKAGSLIMLFNGFASAVVHFTSYVIIVPYLNSDISLSYGLFWSSLIYVSFPFNYNSFNAKNVGISARGIGVWLAQIYLTFLIAYKLSGHWEFLFYAAVAGGIIVMINIFALQFILIGTPIFALFIGDLGIIIALIGSLAFFFILSPKVALNYFQGQLIHKNLYSKYLAKVFILKHRKSIWLDFVLEFPKRCFWLIADFKKNENQISYIWQNSVVVFFIQMTASFLVLFYIDFDCFFEAHDGHSVAGMAILTCVVIFILTTFKISRFLGEPERYVELGFCIVSIILAINGSLTLFIVLISFNIVINFLQLFLFKNHNQNNGASASEIGNIRQALTKRSESEDIRLLIPNTSERRKLCSVKYKQADWGFYSYSVGGIHISKLFENGYNEFNEEVLPDLINNLNLSHMVVNNSNKYLLTKLGKDGFKFDHFFSGDSLHIYSISRKNDRPNQ